MKIKLTKNALAGTIALGLLTASYSGTSAAIDYYLCAKQGDITLSDGTVVPMWGFVPDTTNFANGCGDPIQVPGPTLTVPDSDQTLNIHVRNVGLSEPVSIVIPGQNSTTMVPVMRPGVSPPRVQSFTHETASVASATDNSNDTTYSWTAVKPGTFAYQSGTHPAVQIQMGLYGALIKNQLDVNGLIPGQAYGPSTAFSNELTVIYSEIDTVLHNQVADGTYGTPGFMTSTIDYNPQYFLANGVDSSTGELDAGAPGSTTLIRFINMGLQTHIPSVHGDDFAIIAEDGYAYGNPRNQYSAMVAAGQTKDVLFTPPPLDPQNPSLTYPMFDRMLNLTNGSSIVTAAAGNNAVTSPGSLVTILGTNSDEDDKLDYKDNCMMITNSDQRDTDNDGFGNICDADLDGDGRVGFSDFGIFRAAFGTTNPDADFDGDGRVGFSDFGIFRAMFGGEPGPSGTAE
jgi:FtsP/CotA-like multicopper oxidase with cupredoxin domain